MYFESHLSYVNSVLLHLMVMAEKKKGRPSHCFLTKSASDEQVLLYEAVSLFSKYINKYFGNGSSKGR